MVGKYLSKLESEKFLDEKLDKPPPECSSFYWNNCYKYKVYIPTKNRDIYINMEEYNAYEIIRSDLGVKDWWTLAKKNVCLAIAPAFRKKDREVYCNMLKLKDRLLKKREQLLQDKEANDPFSIPLGSCKYYVLLVYAVNDLNNVEGKDRYSKAEYCERMFLSEKDHKLIDLFDTTFETIEKRFACDSKREVFCYSRGI